ncbi:MAG TPA: hypothetical protein VNH16_03495 [Burkholderiales bacterium]|jgi:hypothetical protein|nr:hypothetical protein [Burkholderiales bacterium]
MVACTHDEFPQPPKDEHPIVALLAVVAIVAAIVLITWARFEIHGTGDIEAALTDGPLELLPDEQRELDAAVTSNRFAGGVSPQ